MVYNKFQNNTINVINIYFILNLNICPNRIDITILHVFDKWWINVIFRAQKLLPTDFIILSEKITGLFPAETKSTYYVPRVPGNKKCKPVNAKGKLIDKYRNLCRTYLITDDDREDTENGSEANNHINVGKGNIYSHME